MSNSVRRNVDIPALLAVSWAARRLSLACVRDSSFALACILMYSVRLCECERIRKTETKEREIEREKKVKRGIDV